MIYLSAHTNKVIPTQVLFVLTDNISFNVRHSRMMPLDIAINSKLNTPVFQVLLKLISYLKTIHGNLGQATLGFEVCKANTFFTLS